MKEWDQFLLHLEQELGSEIPWLRKVARFDAGNIYLEVHDPFHLNWFEEHVRPHLSGLVNENGRPLKVHLGAPKKAPLKKGDDTPRLTLAPSAIDPDFTIDHFLPSAESLMPFRLISELKNSPPFNPIYLYGPKNSGKTHLLHAAAHLLQNAGKRVFFARAETFTEHVVQAIRLGLMQEFRRVYRDIDALVIDNIDIFSGKSATQEEFFHTFNTLHTIGKPLLFSARVPPSGLVNIEPRLISRFEWGISLSLPPPNFGPILEKKASLFKIALTEELSHFLLSSFSDPIVPLQALAVRSKGLITLELAKSLLSDILAADERNSLTPDQIIKSVAAHYGIRSEDILGKSQMREYALPRQTAMYLIREKLKWPYQKIGQFFGRDHSTVISSVKGMEGKALPPLNI